MVYLRMEHFHSTRNNDNYEVMSSMCASKQKNANVTMSRGKMKPNFMFSDVATVTK